MKSKITCLILSLAFIATGCSEPEDSNNTDSNGQIRLSFVKSIVPQEVETISVTLARAGVDTISASTQLIDSVTIVEVNDLLVGLWSLRVDALDSASQVRYSGSTVVNVVAGLTTLVELNLQPSTGSVELRVTFGGQSQGINGDYAMAFDGIDDWVEILPSPLEGLGTATISFWVRFDAVQATKLIMGGDSPDPNPNFTNEYFGVFNDSLLFVGCIGVDHEVAVTTGTWYHVALTFEAGVKAELYVNGQKVFTKAPPSCSQFFTIDRYRFGSRGSDAGPYQHFHGALDDVQFWSIVRTEGQIQAGMDQHLVGDESGLISYYRFDEGSGQVAVDQTARFHGTLGTTAGSDSADPEWIPTTWPH